MLDIFKKENSLVNFNFACDTQISGITIDCQSNTAGVRQILLTDFNNVSGITFDSINIVSGITLDPGEYYQVFDFQKNSAGLDEVATINEDNGTTFYTSTITLRIPKNDAAKRNKILVLADGQRKMSAIAIDNNGEAWLLGYTLGCTVSELTAGRGLKKDDFNGYAISIKAEEPTLSFNIDPTIIANLIQP